MASQFRLVTPAARRRSAAVLLLVGLAGAGAIGGPSAFAAGKGEGLSSKTVTTVNAPAAGKTAPPAGVSAPVKTRPSSGSGVNTPNPVFTSTITQLERANTIDQTQAQAIVAQIETGSLDLQQLVDDGTITAAQGQTVGDALAQAKMSLATNNGALAAAKRSLASVKLGGERGGDTRGRSCKAASCA